MLSRLLRDQPSSHDRMEMMNPDLRVACEAYEDPFHSERERQRFTTINDLVTGNLQAVRLEGSEDIEEEAVVVLYPYATGDERYMRSILSFMQQGLGRSRQMLGIPYGLHRASPDFFQKSDEDHSVHEALAEGQLNPYCLPIVEILERKNIKKIDIVGLEQGASMALTLAETLQMFGSAAVKSATLIEPINTVLRTEWQLLRSLSDFPSSAEMKKMLNVPGLSKIRRDFPQSSPVRASMSRNRILEEIYAARTDPVCVALLKGICLGRFGHDLARGGDYPKVIARGERSAVCPNFDLAGGGKNVFRTEVPGIGRELACSPLDITKLVQRAISAAENRLI